MQRKVLADSNNKEQAAAMKPTKPAVAPPQATPSTTATESKATSYAEHKEQQKRLRRAKKDVEESETRIATMEARKDELDKLLMDVENASNMELVNEYTSLVQALDKEVERWERLSERLEQLEQ